MASKKRRLIRRKTFTIRNTVTIQLDLDEIRYFRAKRAHLVGPGAETVADAAHEIFGAQSQVEAPSFHALSLRTQGRPTAAEVAKELFDDHRLIRTWGQRGTVHLYHASDWPLVIPAREHWSSGRRGGMPPEALVDELEAHFASVGRPLVRSDLFDLIPQTYVDELADHPGAGSNPVRFAATRLVWRLSERGAITFGTKVGNEQAYAHRSLWHDDLEWPATDAEAANIEATRRYLRAFGPATPQDVAHYLGAKVTMARRWVKALSDDLVEIRCDGMKPLYALADDADELGSTNPGDWPLRIMPMFDTLLMGHRDKRTILPNADEEKLVWKKAAMVAPTVIDRGRIVATWSHKKRTNHVDVALHPLADWSPALLGEFEREAVAFADHLDLELGKVAVE